MTRPTSFLDAWRATASSAGLRRETSERLGTDLVRRHREPHRHYHTVEHIEAVLTRLDELDQRTPITELAAFFHDAIYDPTVGDNEERSADLADAWLAGLPQAAAVASIIRATAGHELPDEAPDGCAAFLDADLAILGASPDRYDAYASGIGAEYAHLGPDAFRTGRAAVLEHFLGRDRLYFTATGRDRWEDMARRNLRRERAILLGS